MSDETTKPEPVPTNTPFFLDKAWWSAIIPILLLIAAKWVKIDLKVEELVAVILPVCTFIYSTKHKQTAISVAKVNGGLGLILLVTFLAAPGCAFFNRLGKTVEIAAPKLLDCGGEAALGELPGAISVANDEIGKAMRGEKNDPIEDVIGGLLAGTFSKFMPCAIEEVLRAWAMAGPGAGLPALSTPEQQLRARVLAHRGLAYLAEQGYLPR